MFKKKFFAEIDMFINSKVSNNLFSGVVAIRHNKNIFFKKSYGFSNLNFKIPNSLNTKFSIASLTKLFTAISIFKLIQNNQLSLDTKITKILNLPENYDDVTIYNLLTHTSEIPDYYSNYIDSKDFCNKNNVYSFKSLEDYLPYIVNKNFKFNHTNNFSYSRSGYILLGLIIESITNDTFQKYFIDNILTPCNMNNTFLSSLDSTLQNFADGYYIDNNGNFKKNIYCIPSTTSTNSGIISTIDDLFSLIDHLHQNKLLSPEYTKLLISPQVNQKLKSKDYLLKYGFGFEFLFDEKNTQIIRYGLAGEEPGVSCRLYMLPDSNVDLIILGNQSLCASSISWYLQDFLNN